MPQPAATRAINPLVADVGSPPIPEAQGWTRRYDGACGPLIDLSQAVPGAAPHPELLRRLADAAGSVGGAKYGRSAATRTSGPPMRPNSPRSTTAGSKPPTWR